MRSAMYIHFIRIFTFQSIKSVNYLQNACECRSRRLHQIYACAFVHKFYLARKNKLYAALFINIFQYTANMCMENCINKQLIVYVTLSYLFIEFAIYLQVFLNILQITSLENICVSYEFVAEPNVIFDQENKTEFISFFLKQEN